MTMSMTTTSTQVMISGAVTTSIPQLGNDQTYIWVHMDLSGGTENVYQVPLGKTFYMMGIMIRGGTTTTISINKSGTSGDVKLISIYATSSMNTVITPSCPICSVLGDATERQIQINPSTGTAGKLWMVGYLVDT